MWEKYFYIIFLKRDNKCLVIIFNRNLTKVWCIKTYMYIFYLCYYCTIRNFIKYLFNKIRYVHFSPIIYEISESHIIQLFYIAVYIFYFKCLKFYERAIWKSQYFFNIQLARFLVFLKFRCLFFSSRMFRSKRKLMKATQRRAIKDREQEI